MKKLVAVLLVCVLGVAAQATIIDDFEDGDVSDYTTVVMLDNNGGVSNTAALEAVGGQWQVTTSAYDGIEQAAYIKAGYVLNVGEELQLDYADNGGNRAGGIFVGLMPTVNVRANYVNVYCETATKVYSRGFDGTTEFADYNPGASSDIGYDTLFIKRYGTNDFEVGFYLNGIKYIMYDRTDLSFGDAGEDLVIGLYTDIRDAGTIGAGDNLAIVPEPATMILLGLGSLLGLRKRK